MVAKVGALMVAVGLATAQAAGAASYPLGEIPNTSNSGSVEFGGRTCAARVSLWRATIGSTTYVQGSMDSRTCDKWEWILILLRNGGQVESTKVSGTAAKPDITRFIAQGGQGTRWQACVFGFPYVCSNEYVVK